MNKLAGLLTVVMTALIVAGCDKMGDGTGVFYVVLSDAMCFNIGYANPNMDSEGDMLALEFHGPIDRF